MHACYMYQVEILEHDMRKTVLIFSVVFVCLIFGFKNLTVWCLGQRVSLKCIYETYISCRLGKTNPCESTWSNV
jgi:hypothetical protein